MDEAPKTKLGTIYADWMPAEAGERILKAAGQPLAEGVTVDHVRDGLCFAAQAAVAPMIVPVDAKARRKLESARNALARYDMIMNELRVDGIPVPGLPDGWLEQAMDLMASLQERRGGERRSDYVHKRLYPYLLALYELTFSEIPTAYYYGAEERDGPTLAFLRQAALELDTAHTAMFARSPVASALLGDGQGGTVSVSLPQGDSLRKAIEPVVAARARIEKWFVTETVTENEYARAYRYAHNLLKFRVFSNRMN